MMLVESNNITKSAPFRLAAVISLLIFLWGLALLVGGQRLQVSARLFGDYWVTSLGTLLVGAAAILAVERILAWRKVALLTRLLFALAALCSLHYIHISSNDAYTNDWGAHVDYARFLRYNWLDPFGYAGRENWHPPVYYYLAGRYIALTEMTNAIPLLTGLRFFSWCGYLLFLLFSLLTFRRAGLSAGALLAADTLLLFWPGGMHIASKLSSEPVYFACYAAAFYYFVSWYQLGQRRHLVIALCLAALTLTVRTNGLILLTIIGIVLLLSLWRRRFAIGHLLFRQWGLVAAAMLAAVFITFHRLILSALKVGLANTHAFDSAKGSVNYTYIDHFITWGYAQSLYQPFAQFSYPPYYYNSFWQFFIKTFLFGEYNNWGWPQLAVAMHVVLATILLYTLLPWRFRREDWRGMLPFVIGLAVPIPFLMGYMVIRGTENAQDARFIYPMLTCFAVWFGRAYDHYLTSYGREIAWAGQALASVFALMSVLFFWNVAR